MDLSKFSDSEFDVKQWVNGALRSQKDSKTPVDGHASTLVMKLQLFIQEVSNSLEETSSQVVQSLPRVLRDVEAVKQEALLLREQMQIVKEDIKKVEMETSHSMQRLVELDVIKTRMQDSQKALQEADNWTTLSADVEEVFATQDINQISEKVIGMQQSLNVLHDVPDYEDRKKILESLKNRLEALLVPKLTAAFNEHCTNEAQCYFEIFTGISREKRVKDYYVQCHKNYIQKLWSALQDPENPLIDVLSKFYNELLSKWTVELNWCNEVFSSPLMMLGSLFGESLNSLSPPLNHCLHSDVHRSQTPILTLINLRNSMKEFLKNFQKTFETGSALDDGDILYSCIESIHLPYCQLLVQYGSMEQQSLVNDLMNITITGSSPEEILQSVSLSIPKVMNLFIGAVDNCTQLTDGWGITALVKCIEAVFVKYIKRLMNVLQQLRVLCGIDESNQDRIQTTERGSENGNNGQDEWIDLQWAFQFIQCCGDLLLRSSSLDSQLSSFLLSKAWSYRNPATITQPFGVFDYLRLYHPEEHTAVMELLQTVEKSENIKTTTYSPLWPVGDQICDGGDYRILPKTVDEIKLLTETSHTLAFDILFAHLKRNLIGIPNLKVWESGVSSPLESPRALTDDLPSFSRSPLSYITEIGDYLLTLPQKLDPFTSQDNPSLVAAMKLVNLPYIEESSILTPDEEETEHPCDKWLCAISHGTMDTYVNSILQIHTLNEESSQQLATDIGYLCNVLAALDQHPTSTLTSLEKLLKADKEMFDVYKTDKQISKELYQTISTQRSWN